MCVCVCVCVCVIEPLDCMTSLISWEYVFITYGVKNLVASGISDGRGWWSIMCVLEAVVVLPLAELKRNFLSL